MGRSAGALFACLVLAATGCQALYGGKPDRLKNPAPKKRPPVTPPPAKAPADVGQALRTAYDDALQEEIPAEFRDLLDKLG